LFFAATGNFNEAFANIRDTHALILSMRGVPLIDTSGLQALADLHKRLAEAGGTLMLAGVTEPVSKMLARGGLADIIGPHNVFWSSDQAIVEAERRGCALCRKEDLAARPKTVDEAPESASVHPPASDTVMPPLPQRIE
jgi:SulP family sulfate permease